MKRENDELKLELSVSDAELFEDTFADFEENAEVTDEEKQRVLSSVMRKAGFEMNGIIKDNKRDIKSNKAEDAEVRRGNIQVRRGGVIAACIAVLAVGAVTAGILHNNNIQAATPDKYTLTAGSGTSGDEDNSTAEEDIPAENIMPDMVGKKLTDVLEEYDGRLKFDIISEYNEEYEEGMIYAQSIPAGEEFSVGDTVTLKVSHDKGMSAVPDVVGKDSADAEYELKEAGFTVVQHSIFDDEIPEGKAISTDPPAGEKAEFESIITMYVSKGSSEDTNEVAVPEVRGMTEDEAVKLLKDMGLKVKVEYLNNRAEKGMVVDQAFEPDRKLKKDEYQTIYVSEGMEGAVELTLNIPLPSELHGVYRIETCAPDGTVYYVDTVDADTFEDDIKYAVIDIAGLGTERLVIIVTSEETGKSAEYGEFMVDYDQKLAEIIGRLNTEALQKLAD